LPYEVVIGSGAIGPIQEAPGVGPMLPPFIIEQIRRREEQERAHHEQPHLEIPVDRPAPRSPQAPEESVERGVVIIDLMTDES
jgi:hypothetical protein